MDSPYILNPMQIFIFFLIMLGPMRFKAAYAKSLTKIDPKDKSKMAWKIGAITTATLLIGGYLGSRLLVKWQISHSVLLLAAGILFFMSIFRRFFGNTTEFDRVDFEHPEALDIALHMVISQYGLAVVILLMSFSQDNSRLLSIVMCLLAVMSLNVLTMIFTRPFTKKILAYILEPILGTLQFALSIQMIVIGLNMTGVKVL